MGGSQSEEIRFASICTYHSLVTESLMLLIEVKFIDLIVFVEN